MPIRTIAYLATVAACTRTHGYMSKNAAKRQTGAVPTSTLAREIHGDPAKQSAVGVTITDADHALAQDALTWARETLPEQIPSMGVIAMPDASSFAYKLAVSVAEDEIRDSRLAIAASLISTYQRETGSSAEAKAYASKFGESSHFGSVDERNIWAVHVEDVRPISANGRISWLVTMTTARGDVAKWWASFEPAVKPGADTLVCGTIHRHSAHYDVPETILQRCVFQH